MSETLVSVQIQRNALSQLFSGTIQIWAWDGFFNIYMKMLGKVAWKQSAVYGAAFENHLEAFTCPEYSVPVTRQYLQHTRIKFVALGSALGPYSFLSAIHF